MSTTTLISFAEFEQLPYPEAGKQELVEGEVLTMPPPVRIHSLIAVRLLARLLASLAEGRVLGDKTGYRIGGGWLEPDASVIWPDQRFDENYFLGSPMVAVEILSPGEDIEPKLTLYFEDGAAEVWVIDPRYKSMTVYAREDGKVVRSVVRDEYRSENIPFTLRLAEIFAES